MERIVMKEIPKHGGTFMTRAEQETIVSYGALDTVASINSTDPVVWRKLDRMCEKCPNDYKLVRVHEDPNGKILSKWYEAPKKLIGFRSPSAPRVMTDEQKQALADRLREARMAKPTEDQAPGSLLA